MLRIKKCRKCGKYIIKQNDKKARDKKFLNFHRKNKKVCRC